MIVSTAGHVDHGKSALVQLLTGREMDRAPEARRRGMTIELGFAPMALPSGEVAEIIDVPGHEDFVRTMIAGASGADLALLVVAADEGWMPQSEEHLRVLEQLGVPRGLPLLTKCDLVPEESLELVRGEILRRLARSPIAFAQPIDVSVRDRRGVPELLAAIDATARVMPPRAYDDFFRLPVDRVMSIDGVGTVVAGTCWTGSIQAGSEVRLAPGEQTARVRSIESQGRPIATARAGWRVALALPGVERTSVRRGATIVSPTADWSASRIVDVMLPEAPPPETTPARRTRVRVHLATDDVMGWLAVRHADAGGAVTLARLSLDRAILARGGDRLVLRLAGAAGTTGARVVDPFPEKYSTWPPALLSDVDEERLEGLVLRRRAGMLICSVPAAAGIAPGRVVRAIRARATLQRTADRLVTADHVTAAGRTLLDGLARFHRQHPAERGMSLETLRRTGRLEPAIVEAAIVKLRAEGTIVSDAGLARAADFHPRVLGGDAVVAALVDRISAAGFAPPSVGELAESIGRPDTPAILRIAAASGEIEAVERDRYFARTALEAFVAALRAEGFTKPVSIGRLREVLGISRKYLIPLLEWADRMGYTVRSGDTRRVLDPHAAAARQK